MLMLCATMTVMTLMVFEGLAWASRLAGQKVSTSHRIQCAKQRIAGIVFLGLAAKLILQS